MRVTDDADVFFFLSFLSCSVWFALALPLVQIINSLQMYARDSMQNVMTATTTTEKKTPEKIVEVREFALVSHNFHGCAKRLDADRYHLVSRMSIITSQSFMFMFIIEPLCEAATRFSAFIHILGNCKRTR